MLLQALEISKFSQGTTSCTIIDDLATEDKFATNIEYYSQAMFQFSILLSRKFSLIEHFRGLRVFRGSTPTARSAGRSTSQSSWSDQCVREAGASNAVR